MRKLIHTNSRGDTLIEVTFALVILGSVLVASSLLALKGFQAARTAAERTKIVDQSQEQMEALRSFRDNHTWNEFLNGGGATPYDGVMNASTTACRVSVTCMHMTLTDTSPIVTEYVPVGGYIAGDVPTSYMEIVVEPGPGAIPDYVDFTLHYGFERSGGGPEQVNHIKTRLTNVRI